MTTTPNYGALLQSFWTPPTTSIEEYTDLDTNNAYREVHPRAIYKRQDGDDLSVHLAQLDQ
jgi:hypothetical protein